MTPAATRHIDRAALALAAYERHAFPGKPSLLQRDAFYTQALLMALVCDLEHYAKHHGVNFASAVSTGRALNVSEVAEDAPYKVGDQVRLIRQDDRCGTVIGWHDDSSDAETSFLVVVPGIPYLYAESAAHLAAAPAFPPTQTVLGAVHRADQAEQLYITITERSTETAEPLRQVLEHDGQRLLSALSNWSGIPETRLHDELVPRRPGRRNSTRE